MPTPLPLPPHTQIFYPLLIGAVEWEVSENFIVPNPLNSMWYIDVPGHSMVQASTNYQIAEFFIYLREKKALLISTVKGYRVALNPFSGSPKIGQLQNFFLENL